MLNFRGVKQIKDSDIMAISSTSYVPEDAWQARSRHALRGSEPSIAPKTIVPVSQRTVTEDFALDSFLGFWILDSG